MKRNKGKGKNGICEYAVTVATSQCIYIATPFATYPFRTSHEFEALMLLLLQR